MALEQGQWARAIVTPLLATLDCLREVAHTMIDEIEQATATVIAAATQFVEAQNALPSFYYQLDANAFIALEEALSAYRAVCEHKANS